MKPNDPAMASVDCVHWESVSEGDSGWESGDKDLQASAVCFCCSCLLRVGLFTD